MRMLMCAIAGMISLKSDESVQTKMMETMRRRGPDGSGVYQKDECTLLHTRLAIIDPEGGSQPMQLQWAGESYCISYNGEIYNTEEVRSALRKEGHSFQGHSDTEVVLHAYAQWKDKALDMLNGIFAFAIWEEKQKRLFLARDRIGVKPLFYMLHNGGLLFASEIKTILAYPGVQPRLDRSGIYEVLLLGPGRTPGCGVFQDIKELEPGCCAWFENQKLRISRYWQLKDYEHTDTFEETVEKVRYLVMDSIRRQMVSDVPIGTFLSGGLDSSIISAVCANAVQNEGGILDTFSVDYENNEKYFVANKFQPNSDPYYIRKMEDHLSTRHHWTVLTAHALVQNLENATLARDLPGMADVDFSLLAFCKEIRKDVKVALSGECADEIFGGYPWYRDPEVRALDGFPWAQNTLLRKSFLLPEWSHGTEPEDYVRERYAQTIRQSDILPGTNAEEQRMKEMVNLNFRWFMQTLLDRKDRMSMYNSLEVRVPFCDYRIAQYLYGVPWAFKDHNGVEKGLLRKAVEGLLPQEVLYRKKSPYPKTYDPQYLTLVSGMLRQVISDAHSPILQIVRKEALEQLLNAEYTWPWYGQLMKVPQTVAYMLQINFWLSAYKIQLI